MKFIQVSVIFLTLALAMLAALAQDTTPAPQQGAASNLPDISFTGNIKGSLGSHGIDADTNNHIQLDEAEITIASKLYPGVSGVGVFTVGGEKGDSAGVEESYIDVEQLTSAAPVGARLGIRRLPFGKANPLHPHSLPYADTPSALQNLLGEFRGNGFELVGLVPTHTNLFLQAQLGQWKSVGDPGISAPGTAAPDFNDRPLTLGRLWASAAIGDNNEVELGASGASGNADTAGSPTISLLGVDGTWRIYLPQEKRIMFQGEAIQRTDAGAASRGYYLLGTYRPGHYYEVGARYDWSEFAADAAHHESYLSLFGTRYLTEQTLVRLQVKHGDNHDGQTANELLLQVIFGFGPHTHPLQ